METNATEFRRTEQGGSKLARAVRRHALTVDADAIVTSDGELMEELDARWRVEDKRL